MRIRLAFAAATAALCAGATSSLAATATGTFTSQMTITAECKVQSASTLDFGSYGVLDLARTASSAIGVQCTNGQGYSISLDGGNGSSGTTTTRTMEKGAEAINYTIWQNSGHSQNWGTSGAEVMTSLTGNGSVQSYPVYGVVPIQATPSAGNYTDTVTITVTYP